MCNLILQLMFYKRESNLRGRLSTVDLLVPTRGDQLLFIIKILFTTFTKQAALMRRSTVLSHHPQLVFPVACTINM